MEVFKSCKKLFDRKLEQILEDKGISGNIIGYDLWDDKVEVMVKEKECNCHPLSINPYMLDQKLFIDSLD